MLIPLLAAFTMATGSGPMDEALRATEAPNTMRAAFTVDLLSDRAQRTFRFDPREPIGKRWTLIDATGEDSDLDQAAAAWGAEAAPDGRLFPDDLRASFGQSVSVEDLGAAWRVRFRHAPSANDTEFDVWAAERLDAVAWLEPTQDRFLRIDYSLPKPVRGPDGGRLVKFEQTYLLEREPRWDMSFIASFSIDLEARAAFQTIRRAYSARVTDAEFFFATSAAETAFEAGRNVPRQTSERR
ncbi:MAG: hypothetical protein AAFY37_03175 [Pseudomonadota bacterium]